MASNRYISTSFWDDKWIQTLDSQEKLLYMYLLTNPLTTLAGVYRITIRRISFDTKIDESIVSQIIKNFKRAKKVFMRGDWIILPNFPKHQKITARDNIRTNIDSTLRSLPDNIFQFIISCGYKYIFLEELDRYQSLQGISLGGPSKDLSKTSNYTNLNTNQNSNIKIKKILSISSPSRLKQQFIKPTLEEVLNYIKENGILVDAEQFFDYYESNGWVIGKTTMQDWKASVHYWERNSYQSDPNKPSKVKKPLGVLNMEEE